MPGSSNTSFIPKRNPALKDKPGGRRQVYVGTFIVRILFVAVLIATAGVFLYERSLQSDLDAEIVALSTAISSFNEAEMQRVLEVEKRITQASYRLDHAASMIGLFRAIEASTVGSAQITSLTMQRLNDAQFEVEAEFETASFDSVLFQRNILEEGNTLVVEEIKDIILDNPPPETALFAGERANREDNTSVAVGFQALMSIQTDAIPHSVAPVVEQVLPMPELPATDSASSSPELPAEATVISNEETI